MLDDDLLDNQTLTKINRAKKKKETFIIFQHYTKNSLHLPGVEINVVLEIRQDVREIGDGDFSAESGGVRDANQACPGAELQNAEPTCGGEDRGERRWGWGGRENREERE